MCKSISMDCRHTASSRMKQFKVMMHCTNRDGGKCQLGIMLETDEDSIETEAIQAVKQEAESRGFIVHTAWIDDATLGKN